MEPTTGTEVDARDSGWKSTADLREWLQDRADAIRGAEVG